MSTRGNPDHGRLSRKFAGQKNNVLIESDRVVKLKCGHQAKGHPVVVYPNRRELWQCPQGCGLVLATQRIWGGT